MTLIDQYDRAYNPDFVRKIQMAVIKVAIQVQAEDPNGLAVPPGIQDADPKLILHDARIRLAFRVLYEPERYARLFSFAVAVNPAIDDKSEDNDFEFSVSAVWNAFSLGATS